jgi:hypothetical protein
MGCDIHIAIERQDESGAWREVPYAVEPWEPRSDSTPWNQKCWAEVDALTAKGIVAMPRTFRNRNYDLFGILADVRNGIGFAGIDTGDAWPSIAPERGLPADSTIKDTERDSDDEAGIHWLGYHSHTWISLDELRSFDWDGVKRQARGYDNENRSARTATFDWIDDVLPPLDRIAAGRPLRLILGFDS